MSLSESQSVSENGENRKILLYDRIQRYCREHSQKFHTNEKLHASERLWSESHFRLVFFRRVNGKPLFFVPQQHYPCMRYPNFLNLRKLFTLYICSTCFACYNTDVRCIQNSKRSSGGQNLERKQGSKRQKIGCFTISVTDYYDFMANLLIQPKMAIISDYNQKLQSFI